MTPASDGPKIALLVGNPRPGSRTLAVGHAVANRVAVVLGGSVGRVVDLAVHGPAVLDPSAAEVTADVKAVAASDVLVVASPTYKATYTGLLKAFLDRYDNDGLRGRVGIPVMVAGAPVHALAGEWHLRPLLVELGATVPTRALCVLDYEFEVVDVTISKWLESAADPLRAAALPRLEAQ